MEVDLEAAESWHCPTCLKAVATQFCAECGEERFDPRILSIRAVSSRLIHAATDIDEVLLRSIWSLLRYPGEQTQCWSEGVRKRYVGPLQLLLMANVLFFAVQSLAGENIFSTNLASHLHQQDWSSFANSLVQQRLHRSGESLDEYSQIFDRAVVFNAKSLIVLMAVPFSMTAMIIFRRSERPFLTHIVFAAHTYAFLLILFCGALVVAKLCQTLTGRGLSDPVIDNAISLALLLVSGLYLFHSIPRVYGIFGARRLAGAATLTVAAAMIAIGYRFALLLITLYAT